MVHSLPPDPPAIIRQAAELAQKDAEQVRARQEAEARRLEEEDRRRQVDAENRRRLGQTQQY
jgi:hypothetical protein